MPNQDYQRIREREANYWDERFILVEKVKQRRVDRYYNQMKRQFTLALRRMEQKLQWFFAKFSDEENISFQEAKKQLTDPELEDFKMDLSEYLKKMDQNAIDFDPQINKELERASMRYRVTRLEAMEYYIKAYVAELFGNVNAETYKLLTETYQDQYARTAYEIFKGTGIQKIDFSIPELTAANLVIRTPWRADGLSFARRYGGYSRQLMQDLADGLERVLINGEGYDVVARAFAGKLGATNLPGGAMYKTKRLIYTESAYFCGLAQNQCFKDLGVERYKFHAQFNTRVCGNCGDLDGQIFELKDRRVGVNAAPMHPNCRCVEVPYVDNSDVPGYVEEQRTGRNEEGKSVLFPESMTYKEWYEKVGQKLEEKEAAKKKKK